MLKAIRYACIAVLTLFVAGQCRIILAFDDSLSGWRVNSLGDALQLSSVEELPTGIAFNLTNKSDKVITAYSICFGSDGLFNNCHEVDWSTDDSSAGLVEGKSDKVILSLNETAQYKNRILQIAAVLFEDGSTEGTQDRVTYLHVKRLGRTLELYRSLSIISSFMDSAMNDSDIENLKNEIGHVPTEFNEQLANEMANARDKFIPQLALPNFAKLSNIIRLSFVTGISTTRNRVVFTIMDMRTHPIISADKHVATRAIYMSAFRDLLRKRSGKMVSDVMKTQEKRRHE